MRNGMPAFVNYPPRVYSQRIQVLGFQPTIGEWFTAATQDEAGYAQWRAEDLERFTAIRREAHAPPPSATAP